MEERETSITFLTINKNEKGQMIHKRLKQTLQNQALQNVYKNIKLKEPNILKKDAIEQLSVTTGICDKSIRTILLKYKRNGEMKSHNRTQTRLNVRENVNEYDKTAIRRIINSFYLNGELPTIDKILSAINDDDELTNISRSSLDRLLCDLSLVHCKRQTNCVLTERGDLICWRRKYLESIRKYRSENRRIYYLGETWINLEDGCSNVSVEESTESLKDAFLPDLSPGAGNASEKGALIVVHIGSEAGFVPGGLLCFKSNENSSDYQNEMNGNMFREWFEQTLLLLDDNCVIVMDNSRYHSVKQEKLPKMSWEKDEIKNWLSQKGFAYDASMIKDDLVNIVKMVKYDYEKFFNEEITIKTSTVILRLPPYHSELNPIAMAWSRITGYVKKHNTTFKLPDMEKLFHEGIDRVTPEHWKNFVMHAVEEEKKSWMMDDRTDKLIDFILDDNTATRISSFVISNTAEASSGEESSVEE